LSPLLFSLYVDPLEEELWTEDATDDIDGDFLSLAGVPVPCLLFADDLVLLSSTRAGLQAMLGTLERFSRRTGLTVNRDKTKVVVFGAQLQKAMRERAFYIDRGAIETVESYRYLKARRCRARARRQQCRLSVRLVVGLRMPYDRDVQRFSCMIPHCGLSCLTVL
jgi:hypothetical protein